MVYRPGPAGDRPDVCRFLKPEDSGLDIGDSAITETYGIGGFAMATAPAIVALVGGTVEEAVDFSRQMREITLGENPNVTIPLLGFMGIPTAIDITRVGSSGIFTGDQHRYRPQRRRDRHDRRRDRSSAVCLFRKKAILSWCDRYDV